mmetsp:Transcript_18254/g.28875  ORF Transcript_18254/g.28875 Transcript_18254/m.28875 type:complete len:223 (-) Transcript_18254:565-1233(-)
MIDQTARIRCHHPADNRPAQPMQVKGTDHRRTRRRKLQSDRAGGRQSHVRRPKSGPLFNQPRLQLQTARIQNNGRHRPVFHLLFGQPGHSLRCGQNHPHPGPGRGQSAQRFAKDRAHARNLSAPRSGQHQHQGVRPLQPIFRTKISGLARACLWDCRRRMADKVTLHPDRFHQGRLKGEKRQHLINHRRHFLGPTGPPRPHGRGHVMHCAHSALRLDQFGHA